MDEAQPTAPRSIQYPANYDDKQKQNSTQALTDCFTVTAESIALMQEKINKHEVTFEEAFKGQFAGLNSAEYDITYFLTILKVISCISAIPLIGILFAAAYDRHNSNANLEAFRKQTKNFTEATSLLLDYRYSYPIIDKDEVESTILPTEKNTKARKQIQEAGDAWSNSIVKLLPELNLDPKEIKAFFAACATHLMLQNTSIHASDKSHRATISGLAVETALYVLKKNGAKVSEIVLKQAVKNIMSVSGK